MQLGAILGFVQSNLITLMVLAIVVSYVLMEIMGPKKFIVVHLPGHRREIYPCKESASGFIEFTDNHGEEFTVKVDDPPETQKFRLVSKDFYDLPYGSKSTSHNFGSEAEKGTEAGDTKEVLHKAMRAAENFKALAAGLRTVNKWQAITFICVGLFAGLFVGAIWFGGLI